MRDTREVVIAAAAQADETGIRFEGPAGTEEVGWDAIVGAVAAEVGEPQGVCAIVFDLRVRRAGISHTLRLDADPGEGAIDWARQIAAGIGVRAGPSIKALAIDGVPSRWFPDLASFEADEGEADCLFER
ncbi:MAG: hypothetical protein AAF430_13460 [Myxococcota bacterium]